MCQPSPNTKTMAKFKNILSLSAEQARDFLMQDNQYHTFELPEYFNFEPILQYVKDTIGDAKYEDCLKKGFSPESSEGVSMSFLLSKDGQYAVRPLTLSNPVLYWMLVREICKDGNWKKIKECFSAYRIPQFEACALPVIPEEKEPFYKSTVILNWWNRLEQRILELSMEYNYMFVTDITNCYGSFNPQSIDWALSLKGTSHEKKGASQLSENIRQLLKSMQQGNNIGIPQGSTIYDFIAEIILGYADLLLSEKLQSKGISDYKVLRYRDDYRIFCNDGSQLEVISYTLQEVLESLNLRMNSQKTKTTENLVYEALKYDKRDYILNTPICNKSGYDFDGLQKHLYFIYLFGREHKDCGQLKVMLNDFDKRLLKQLYPDNVEEVNLDEEELVEENKEQKESCFSKLKVYGIKKPVGVILENIHTMVAIATQIAFDNISAAPLALRVITRLMTALNSDREKVDLMNMVVAKLSKLHNMSYLQVWLQNMTFAADKVKGENRYSMPLCKLAMGEKCSIWNLSWLRSSLIKDIPYSSICDNESLENLPPVIVTRPIKYYTEFVETEN